MPQKRKDRTVSEWEDCGENLLIKLSPNRQLTRKLKALLKELKSTSTPDETVTKLNTLKYPLGDDWRRLVQRMNQKPKDCKRSKFYVSEKTFNNVMAFTKNSEYEDNSNRSIEQLFVALTSLGLTNISDVYELAASLDPFKDALKPKVEEQSLGTSETPHEYSIVIIAQRLAAELKINKIQDFRSIASIKQKKREAEKLTDGIDKLLADKQNEIDELNRQNQQAVTKQEEIKATMQKQIDLLKSKLKSPNNSQKSGINRFRKVPQPKK
jgi:hypothetical protein